MNHKNIVDLVHVGFIQSLLPQFLTDGLVNVLLFGVDHLCILFGTLGAVSGTIVDISGSGKVSSVLVIMAGLQILL